MILSDKKMRLAVTTAPQENNNDDKKETGYMCSSWEIVLGLGSQSIFIPYFEELR